MNPNHPPKGSSIKVEPIRRKAAIERIKAALLHGNKYRDYCLFTLGINTALRANELLSLRIDQVLTLQAGDRLDVKQSKNGRYRAVTLNRNAAGALRQYIENDKELQRHISVRGAPLFYSRRGDVLTVQAVHAMVKSWCEGAGCKGNYGSHTLRKTWGYWQYMSRQRPHYAPSDGSLRPFQPEANAGLSVHTGQGYRGNLYGNGALEQ